MEADKDKMNAEPNRARSSRLTCADCAVDIDKLLGALEEDGSPVDKSSQLVFDISCLGAATANSTSENAARDTEQGKD